MARPSKPVSLHLANGNKRHLTKKEIEKREKEEKALVSGASFKEWEKVKENPDAHKEFVRLKKVFRAIKKDDALHESVINRFCLLHAECLHFENLSKSISDSLDELEKRKSEIEFFQYLDSRGKLLENFMKCDKKIMEKRKAMLEIEKENIMTIAGVLRSIPKKPEEEKTADPMERLLGGHRV